MENHGRPLASGEDSPGVPSRSEACLAAGTRDEDPERRQVKLAPVADKGAEPGGDVERKGAVLPSIPETNQEKKGGSLPKNLTAPSDGSEMSPRSVAGDSSEKSQKKKRKRDKEKKDPSSSEEQDSLPSLITTPAQTTELPDTCVIPQEIQTVGSKVAQLGADVLAGNNRGANESKRALGHLGKEAGGLEVVAERSHSSVDVMAPPKQSSTDNAAAPSPSSVAPKEKMGADNTMECREAIRRNVEGGSRAMDAGQLPETRLNSQSLGSSKKLASTVERTSVSSELSPNTGKPKSKPATPHAEHQSPDTKTPAVVKSLQAGKMKQDSRQKASCSPSRNEDTKEKKSTPSEKEHKITEKTSPTKQPEVARRGDASAVADSKDKTQKRNQKPVDKVKESSVSRSDGVTVHFHAILSNDFKLDPKTHKVFIRAEGISPYEDWKDNICEMKCTEYLREHGHLIEGTVTLSKQNVDKYIPYKYLVSCGECEYEFIYKDPVSKGPVNRCLFIKSQLLNNGEWHQYDDIVCKKPSRMRSAVNYVYSGYIKGVVKGKIIAANIMLEDIFSILEIWSPDNLKYFLSELKQFYTVVVGQWVYDGKAMRWTELDFGKKQVDDLLLKHIKKITLPFLAPEDKKASQENTVIKNKLALGLTILVTTESLELPTPEGYLSDMCRLLCMDKKSQQEILHEMNNIKKAFPVTSLKIHLINLCQRCIDEQVDEWIWILPLLHFFAAPLQQDHFAVEEGIWAGLEGLAFAETRKKQDMGKLLKLMTEKKYLMEVSKTVVKSWICVLPLESLAKFIQDFPSDLLTALQGVSYRLENTYFPWSSTKVLESLVKALLCTLEKTESSGLEACSWQSCLTCCLRLHECICNYTKQGWSYEIPATSAVMISKVARLQPVKIPRDAVQKVPVVELFSEALKDTRTWFRNSLNQNLLKQVMENVFFVFHWELQAWNAFVNISFPDEQFTQRWKKTLLADLERRIKEEPAINQILVYCSQRYRFKQLDSSIDSCFLKCATEAVTKACQTRSNLLDMISSYNMSEFSELVSAIIVKSWPVQSGQPGDYFDEILHHMLTWPDIKHIFSFNGMNTKLREQLSDEAKNVVNTADSVIETVTCDMQKGCILVKRLEEIFQHEKQFISIWETKRLKLPYEERAVLQRRLEELLQSRHREIKFLREERKAIGTFLTMCRKVQASVKVDIGEVEFEYSEDLRSRPLDTVMNIRILPLETYYSLRPKLKQFARKMHSLKDSLIFQQFWEEAAQKAGKRPESSEEENDNFVPLLDLDNALGSLIYPCFVEYETLYSDLRSGKLTLSAVDRIFQEFTNHPEDIKTELNIMCELKPGESRVWVDKRFEQIQQYHEMHLTFDAAKIIASVKETLNLSGDFRILENLLDITEKLESYKRQTLDFISPELMRAKELLQGITMNRRGCLNELARQKEFICWVRESLEDMNELKVFVDLASISAGENDMDVDRVACFHDAVHGYSSLLYELRQDSGFEDFMHCLKKLWRALDSDENLPKKLCASAQHLQWLKAVKETHGSVELSSLSLAAAINSRGLYILRAPTDGRKVSLDNVVRFTLHGCSEGNETFRKYSLAELRELQNKLMLMSVKGEQGLEVEKFSEAFSGVQRLAQAFIDLYSAGNMLFRSWHAYVYCLPQKESRVLIEFSLGLIPDLEGQGDLVALLLGVCKTMEGFLESWKNFMYEKRFQHFYLNYYTAEQLVYLCTELGQGMPSKAALMMLSFLKHNCTKEDIFRASENKVPPSSGKGVSDLQEMLDEEKDLTAGLECIWECYMSDMASFLPNCLDIDTLGRKLKDLASLEREHVTRDFPQDLLRVGQPNLITCPRSEVLTSALAIYMYSPDQPLPTFDEVLLCSPQTTAEQVELFFRRCFIQCSGGVKIYTMLYADELSYDVSCRAEELFQHLQHYNPTYRLVILSNCEREHSYIPSVFSQYKVHMIPQRRLGEIQEYLQQHYRVAGISRSAACVFKDNMCVGIVSSKRAGVGKSLYVKRLHERLLLTQPDYKELLKTIRVIEPEVDENKVLKSLLPFLESKDQTRPMIFHFDITSSVQSGIPEFLFKLLVLQYLTDNDGNMWLRQKCHLYIIEILEVSPVPKKAAGHMSASQKYNFFDVFPKVTCKSPKEVLEMEMLGDKFRDDVSNPGMDNEEFCSEAFQRPFQYLKRYHQGQNLDMFSYEPSSVDGSPAECLQQLLLHCGIADPSWSELRNFTCFLNIQLRDCENSDFCNPAFIQDTLQGFKNFVVTFMILMARDFATPSLNISDQSSGRQSSNLENVAEEDLYPFCIRKKWESEPHPYLFFNEDRVSMTFIGFHLQPNGKGRVDAINPLNHSIIKRDVMTSQLYNGLLFQRVPFNVPFDCLPRHEKLERLCRVLGIPCVTEPDETYELTTDNVLKMLAIEMRFRCNIPVVIMGETGCGKTRLIKFLCKLRRGSLEVENMKLVKVHGGTTAEMIYARIKEAEALAEANKEQHGLDTILFFDEANTTEAVSSIKEVLCDHTVQGKPLVSCSSLQIIAACNPYRKHTQKMIERLELAGLGYRVKADETKDKLGSIPLRQLVYRVHALPPSMIPLVWDFGQLNNLTEKMYIQQIVQKVTKHIPMEEFEAEVITEVLFASQQYMRQRDDECSFVSLRDVERCMQVFSWFHKHSELLLRELEKYLAEKKAPKGTVKRNKVIWSLVLALGVCYHASLEEKEAYRSTISEVLPKPYDTQKKILEEISLMQDLFLSGVNLRDTIARNLALKENVFMMVICIELKIPLFLVGKPGSSKSLAKNIVADAMRGQAAHSDLFKDLKKIHLMSFQCSPLSSPEGIIGTFKHCARFQEGKNLEEYVSVVVLDEIGLAEDSPKMPLKTLHPLLEDGCIDDIPLPHKKVGFIGISNWALDPAKMNRGIFVSRGDPSKEELIKSARGICCSARGALQKVEQYFCHFADAYENICKAQDREFFGLRDYYSLIKMLLAKAKISKSEPTPQDIAEIVLRNFGGMDDVNALEIFTSQLPEKGEIHARDISRIELIRQNIYSSGQDSDCRYLLVLTENYAALQILQQAFFTARQQPKIIFGSSFPKDQEYTQICRNINRVKVCMETGQMVVLLNLQNLYESLYDALNQYYEYFAGQKYVDLGLGTHRVKCRVHPKFRLIVIEEKDVVHKHFPIPLINRLEKHYLDISTVLDKGQREVVEELKKWVDDFTAANTEEYVHEQKYCPSDVFVGYHADTCASVVLQTTERLKPVCAPGELMSCMKKEAQLALLNCATPDSVIRLCHSVGMFMAESLANIYFKKQQHTSFADFLRAHIHTGSGYQTGFTEVTTFSRLLTSADAACLEREVQGKAQRPLILFLQQFDTEYSFLECIRDFLGGTLGTKIIIIQLDFEDGSQNAQLIASAKYTVVNEINKADLGEDSVFVYFIMKLSRVEGGTSYVGFHGGLWQSVHIDDLRRSKGMVSDITVLQNLTISQIFYEDSVRALPVNGEQEEEEMEVETPVPETQHYEGEILDTTVLLRTCVQSAVGMLQDQNEDLNRSRQRIKILLGLLSKEDELKASFLKITKSHISNLLKKQEENSFRPQNWVLREASNISAMQEAGTFRHTLWKRVQKVITPFLALLIAVIDRNGNLELLVAPAAEWVTKLWMFIFSNTKLLTFPYNVDKNSSQPGIILVQNNMMVSADVVNEKMPFSWRIKEYLDEMCLKVQCVQNTKDQAEMFVDIFQETALGKFISTLTEEERQMLFQCYATDFVVLTIGASSIEELQCLHVAFLSCIEEWKATSPRREEMVPSLPWVHLVYNQFKSRLQNFSRILAVHPTVVECLINQQGDEIHSEMVLDVLAAMACAEELESQVQTANPEVWLQKVKNLRMPIEFLCKEKSLQRNRSRCHQLLKQLEVYWNRVFSMSLFIEHVVSGVKTLMPEFENVVKKYVLLLAECFQNDSDMKAYPTFVAVMKVLCECKDEVSNRLYRYGLQPCPICVKEPKDPVCLPCSHVFCLKCIRTWLVPAQLHCPYCRAAVTDVNLTVSEELRDAIAKNALFRQRCNNLFIDVVTTMSFKDNEPPDTQVIQELLNLLFVHRDLTGSDHPAVYTKFLSPFNDEVDETPIIRSVMLKLLLKYSFNEVKNDVQDYLSRVEHSDILEKKDKKELYLLFVNCLEDSLSEKSEGSLGCEHTNYLPRDRGFPENYLPNYNQEVPQESSVEYLQAVAKVRLYLSKAAELLFDLHEHREQDHIEEKQHYLANVRMFCNISQNNWHRVYLVRKIANQYGMEFAQKLVTEEKFNWVFPEEVLKRVQNSQSNHIDRYLACGENYRVLRDAVGTAMIECKTGGLLQAEKASRGCSQAAQPVHLLLGIFREVTALYGVSDSNLHPKPQQINVVNEFIQNSQVLNSPDLREFATSLVLNTLPSLTVDPQSFGYNGALIEMAVHTAAVLLCGQNSILQPLRNLAFHSHTMEHSFLPTMPEDITAQARTWAGTSNMHWYVCRNGHPCLVGECGRPMVISHCIDCGAIVGGQRHEPVTGFKPSGRIEDRTQTGHVLGDPQNRRTMGASDRGMTPAVFTPIRLLTHLAMFLGATKYPKSLERIIKPQVQNPVSFLQRHIQEDLAQLTRILGKSVDETVSIVHLVLSSLLKSPHQHPGQWSVQFDAVLSTKEKRNGWEEIVAKTIIVPELEDLDKKLLQLNRKIQADERIFSNPIVKIVYGDPATFLSQLPKGSHVHHSKMWSCRKRISVENLSHVVQQKNGMDTVPLLWKFLQKETELRLVKFLPEILALQRELVRQFENTADVKRCSIRDFLKEPFSDVMRDLLQRRVEVFLSVWNKLRSSLDTNGQIRLPKGYCDADLTLDSKLEVLLPRRQGLGLCSTALSDYLIRLHNDLIYSVNKYVKEDDRYWISPSEVADLHLINYEVEKDLIPLISSNCQYSMEKGGEILQDFDLERIQQQVISKFLQGKPLISLVKGLPTLVYRHGQNYEKLLNDIRSKVDQSALPSSVMNMIGGELQSYSDVCDALFVTEITLRFLPMAGENAEMLLTEYIENVLKMGDQTNPHVLQALRQCHLKHSIALWQLLSTRKSEQLLRLKGDPFEDISPVYKDVLSPEMAKLLNAFLAHSRLEAFLQELHEMIILRLKRVRAEEDFRPMWSLKESLLPYLEAKDSELAAELEELFPDEILLSHVIATWKAAALFKREHRET